MHTTSIHTDALAPSTPRPLPLGAALPPVRAFDPAWLPGPFRAWISDIAERMQCPPEFPAVAAMTALSSIAGRRFCIQPKTQDEAYTEFPHLWGMLIGSPSMMKSPAMQAAMRPLKQMEELLQREHEGREASRQADEIAARMRRAALESEARRATRKGEPFDFTQLIGPAEGQPTPLRRLFVNDASLEALGEVLRDNPTGTLYYQDELSGLLAQKEKEGNQSLRAFLLQAWSGKEGFTFDRIGRGRRYIEACALSALSVLGSIQPGVVAAHVRAATGHTTGADGFLQRFSLMVWPDVSRDWEDIDRPLDFEAEWDARDVFDSIENLTTAQLIQNGIRPGRDGVPVFRFAPNAQELFSHWRRTLELRLRAGTLAPVMEAHLGKYRKLVPALALLIHTADRPAGSVSLSALESAISWAGYLETHAARVFASGTIAEAFTVHTLLKKLLDGSAGLPGVFKTRDIRRKCWAGLTSQEEVESACEVLVAHHWLIATVRESGSPGSRPTTIYHLNPLAGQSPDVLDPD